MSGPLGSSQWMYSSGDFTLDQSIRVENARDTYLKKDWTTAPTDADKFTFSAWVKIPGIIGASGSSQFWLLGARDTAESNIRFYQDKLQVHLTGSNYDFITSNMSRDPSAWYHIVVVYDSDDGTAADRCKIYVNNVRQTLGTTSTIPSGTDNEFTKNGVTVTVGGHSDTDHHFSGYMAEVHLIDGAALTPSSFGESGNYAEWKPKEVSGLTYGNNGFYLSFKQDYEVEGFNTVIYEGTGSAETVGGPGGQYVGGVGFQPDLVWIKQRNGTGDHKLFDSVRGINQVIKANTVDAEFDDNNALINFHPDGFTVADDSSVGGSGNSYVSWNWDMGGDSYGLPATITASGNTNHSTTQQKIGASSIYFDGSGDYLEATLDSGANANSDFNIGYGDFTMEAWFYMKQISDNRGIFSIGSSAYKAGLRMSSSNLQFKGAGSTLSGIDSNSATHGITINNWHHIAIVRINGTTNLYCDGVNKGSDSTQYEVDAAVVRAAYYYESPYYGYFYMDEFRISNKARYTGSFTPSTTAFSNDKNTLFLLHSDTSNGSTTFVDSSGATPNTTGSINSHVAVNQTYGQSIVSYKGTGSAATIGHGLSGAPEMILVKNRDAADAWRVYHTGIAGDAETDWLELNDTTLATDDAGVWNDTAPTSTVFSVATESRTNESNEDFVAYCFDSVAGYSKFGSFTGNGANDGPEVTLGFAPAFVLIKSSSQADNWTIYDNTRQPSFESARGIIYADGTAAEDVSNSTWFTLGSNSFKWNRYGTGFNVDGQTYIYAAFADKREYAFWLDQSGNNNDFINHNLTDSDIMLDTPTNNFCTLNPLLKYVRSTYPTEGGLKSVCGSTETSSPHMVGSTMCAPGSGKWYWEVAIGAGQYSKYARIGAANIDVDLVRDIMRGINSASLPWIYAGGAWGFDCNNGHKQSGGSASSYGSGTKDGTNIIGIALDVDNGKIWFADNNTWIASGNPVTGANAAFTNVGSGHIMPVVNTQDGAAGYVTVNFGQDSSFAGTKTAQGYQDSNDIGDFYYEPPTDFLALCTSNLPAVAVTPSEAFNTVLYTGTGSSNAITGVGFQPEMTWISERDESEAVASVDILRGNTVEINISSTAAELDDAQKVTAIGSDGFTVGTSAAANQNNNAHVSYHWKAGGSGVSNTTGSNNSTVSANVDAGFSIVTYTGSGGPDTVGHGLSKAPEMIATKNRTTAGNEWWIYHKENTSAPETEYIRWDSDAGTADYLSWNDTAPTSTVFTVGDLRPNNGAWGDSYVAYCWHSVEGFSKVGRLIGSSLAEGPFVYTGFRPMFVFMKNTQANREPVIYDSKRDDNPNNPMNEAMSSRGYAETSSYGAIDFLSNGFKIRENNYHINEDDRTILYLAFAETPFKYSNAR